VHSYGGRVSYGANPNPVNIPCGRKPDFLVEFWLINTEGVIDFGFHSVGANKREAFIYRELSCVVATKSPPPDPLYYK
jgi:hypothetical protein